MAGINNHQGEFITNSSEVRQWASFTVLGADPAQRKVGAVNEIKLSGVFVGLPSMGTRGGEVEPYVMAIVTRADKSHVLTRVLLRELNIEYPTFPSERAVGVQDAEVEATQNLRVCLQGPTHEAALGLTQ